MSVDSETASTPPADAVGVVIADLVRRATKELEDHRNAYDQHRTALILAKNKIEATGAAIEKAQRTLAQLLEVQAWAVPS